MRLLQPRPHYDGTGHAPGTEEEIAEYLAGNLCRCSGYAGQTRALRAWLHDKPWEKEGQA